MQSCDRGPEEIVSAKAATVASVSGEGSGAEGVSSGKKLSAILMIILYLEPQLRGAEPGPAGNQSHVFLGRPVRFPGALQHERCSIVKGLAQFQNSV